MSQVVTFENYTPTARYDSVPWTEVRIQESALLEGPYTLIDTVAFDQPDADPSHPEARSFTTANASDGTGLWYRLIFADAGGDTLAPLFPVQDVLPRAAYATVEELARLLRLSPDTFRDQLERVLLAAAAEIDAELGLDQPYATPPAVVTQVNLERAVEHWQQAQSPFGVLGLGGESGPAFVSRDTWDRHAHKLAPLKVEWGFA
jgi:hypothetical protein